MVFLQEENIPADLTHSEQFNAIVDRLKSKKDLLQSIVGAESVEEAVRTSAPRPIAAVVWKDEINPRPERPKTLHSNCSQDEYRDWLVIVVTEQVGGVPAGIDAKDEVISILGNWRPCQSTTRFTKVNAMFSHNRDDYACSVYSLRFRTWYTNNRSLI